MDQFTTEELEQDLADSLQDIKACQMALLQGVTECSGGRVQDRTIESQERISENEANRS